MNTIQLVIMMYNAEKTIHETLKSYVGVVDRFMLFVDEKTSDGTKKIIKRFKASANVPVKIHNIEFTNFSDTRNECLRQSYNTNFTWTMFVDDSYKIVLRNGVNSLRNELSQYVLDPKVNCISVLISRGSSAYQSKRIIRTYSRIKFEGTIHEVLAANSNACLNDCVIQDIPCEEHFSRSVNRAHYDLKQLEGLTDTRSVYYRACAYSATLNDCMIQTFFSILYGEFSLYSTVKSP